MRNLRLLDQYRLCSEKILKRYGTFGDETCGVFEVPSPTDPHITLGIVASTGEGWDHVSVSTPRRCPNWPEMSHVHELFFDNEVAFQFHIPLGDEERVNLHPYCLHIWRRQDGEIPRPNSRLVGPTKEN